MYGYPYTGLTAYLCYRKDMLNDPKNKREFKARYHRELAAPTTWKEYMQLAEFFNRPREHFYGTYISGKQGLALWYEWLNFVYSYGGNILDTQHGDEYGDIAINSPQNVAATEQYIKLIPFSPPDTLDFGPVPGSPGGLKGCGQDRLQSDSLQLFPAVQPVGRAHLSDSDRIKRIERSLSIH